MPFQFQWLCELLDELHNSRHQRTLTTARANNYETQIIYNWVSRFSHRIERTGRPAVAFLSCLLPERRPDRVYNLQANRLSHVFGRALCLGSSRALELNQWRSRDGADFPTCVETTMKVCENDRPAAGKEVTLEELDEALDLIAAHSVSSSSAIRAKLRNATPTEILTPILHRLQSNEAKWLARMLLKSYAPVQIPEYEALHGFHFMLPKLLTLQNSFEAAVAVLGKAEICQLPARPDRNYEHALQSLIGEHVQPRLGVMITRHAYHKARSIKHCCSLVNGRQMSLERKYDGEFCQIHIDISKGNDCIQIFSKSGKDSTMDRIRLHNAIKDALRIGRNGCRILKQCVIEGELLVWNAVLKEIQPFHKIRKYVRHGGREIGTVEDSPKRPEEQLMIAFYDILILDDLMLLLKAQKVRRQYLKTVLKTEEGRAILCERTIIDFRSSQAAANLRKKFANAITQRWEGLVLKGLNEPYFSWKNQNHIIKLKKDYILGLGNAADLCIVGARRDPHTELLIGLGRLKWTCFYLGAVTNLEAVRRFDALPQIKIIDILTQHSMPDTELIDLNKLSQLHEVDYASGSTEYEVQMGICDMPKPDVLFKKPFVVEIMGAGFEKSLNSSFFTLRFPRKINGKVKLHTDRTILDTVSFDELQRMAEHSLTVPVDGDSREDADWIEKLVHADGINRSGSTGHYPDLTETSESVSILSLSTISSGTKTRPSIFVRPDTEEPESQATHTCIGGSHDASESADASPERSLPPSESRSRNIRHSNEMNIETSRKTRNIESKSKRRCHEQLSRSSHSFQETVCSNSLSETWISVMSQQLEQDKKHSSTHGTKITAFDPPAQFYSPRSTVRTTRIEAMNYRSTTTSLAYDQTSTIRPTTFAFHRRGDDPFNPTTTQVVSNKQSRRCSKTKSCVLVHQSENLSLSTSPSRSARRSILFQPQSSSIILSKPVQPSSVYVYDPQQSPVPTTNVSESPKPLNEMNFNNINMTYGDHIQDGHDTHQNGILAHPTQLTSNPLPPILFLSAVPADPITMTSIIASFTFSYIHFFNIVDAAINNSTTTNGTYHVVLANLRIPNLTADALGQLAREVSRRLPTSHPNIDTRGALALYNDRILVFDWRILQHEQFRDGVINLEKLRALDYDNGRGRDAPLFAGMIEFVEHQDTHLEMGRNDYGVAVRDDDSLVVAVYVHHVYTWLN